MKNILIYLLLLCLTGNACSKKDTPIAITEPEPPAPPPPHVPIIELGKGSGLNNGEVWEMEYEAWYYRSDSAFQIRAKRYWDNIKQSFFITDIPLQVGKFKAEYRATSLNNLIPDPLIMHLVDGDQPTDWFLIDTTRTDHFIEILHIDTSMNSVEGRFQLFMRRRPMNSTIGMPDTMSLTQGKFNLVVKWP